MGHVGPEGLIALMDAVESGTLFVISVNAAHFERAGFADAMNDFAGQIEGLTLANTRIYDDRADDGHRNDMARLIVFPKA